jgi:hypothetical protein
MTSRSTRAKRSKLLISAAVAVALLAAADSMAGRKACDGITMAWESLTWIPSGTVLRPFALFERLCPA